MFKFILILAVLIGAIYVYTVEDMEAKAKSETEGLKGKYIGLKGKLTDWTTEEEKVAPKPVPQLLEVALLTVIDTQGEKLNKSDARVIVYNGNSTIEEYIDSNSQIRVLNVMTLTSYRTVVEEGYGMARLYPQEKNIQFASMGATIEVQRRALIKPLSFSDGNNDYGSQVNLTEGKYLLFFKLKSEGQGVVKKPSIKLIPKEQPAIFKAWIWDYQDAGLGLPESLQKGMLDWNTRYQFDKDLSENAYGTYALQIENITRGKFDFCIYDEANLEQGCATFAIK